MSKFGYQKYDAICFGSSNVKTPAPCRSVHFPSRQSIQWSRTVAGRSMDDCRTWANSQSPLRALTTSASGHSNIAFGGG